MFAATTLLLAQFSFLRLVTSSLLPLLIRNGQNRLLQKRTEWVGPLCVPAFSFDADRYPKVYSCDSVPVALHLLPEELRSAHRSDLRRYSTAFPGGPNCSC